MSSRSLTITFGGAELVLDSAGALYWPSQQLLVVSDMHLEKSTYHAMLGAPLPPYDTQDTLERLEALVLHYTPRELMFLGDSFHDRQAWQRLDGSLRLRIEQIAASVEICSWIEGNHDVNLEAHRHRFLPEREIGGIHFRHDHLPMESAQIIGHFHPSTRITLGNRKLRARCFARAGNLLIMPAFGSYTGGLDLYHEAFAALTPEPWQPYLLYRTSIHALPPLKKAR